MEPAATEATMRVELTVTRDYCPEWGVAEGIRELVQNGLDGRDQFGGELQVSIRGMKLRIDNVGIEPLPHQALLLGHTTKHGAGLRGQHGEGLKIGSLALVRAGCKVVIRTGGEVWIPSIEWSKALHADVLCFDIRSARSGKVRGGIRVEVSPVEDWDSLRKGYLFLQNTRRRIDVFGGCTLPGGSILLDPAQAGCVYVKGIAVSERSDLEYGYDLHDVTLDRDRRVLGSYDRREAIASLWSAAYDEASGPAQGEIAGRVWDMIIRESADVAGFTDAVSWDCSEIYRWPGLTTAIIDRYVAAFGGDAVPVTLQSEAGELEYFGAKAVVTTKILARIAAVHTGTADAAKHRLANATLRQFTLPDLSPAEREAVRWSCGVMRDAGLVLPMTSVRVVEFRSPTLLGQAHGDHVQIARSVLADRFVTLQVLVHEHAHNVTREGDGKKGHVDAIESMWLLIARVLCGELS